MKSIGVFRYQDLNNLGIGIRESVGIGTALITIYLIGIHTEQVA